MANQRIKANPGIDVGIGLGITICFLQTPNNAETLPQHVLATDFPLLQKMLPILNLCITNRADCQLFSVKLVILSIDTCTPHLATLPV